jgi:hypothetical protein
MAVLRPLLALGSASARTSERMNDSGSGCAQLGRSRELPDRASPFHALALLNEPFRFAGSPVIALLVEPTLY